MDRIPQDMEVIFDKPGGEWTDAEKDRVKEWVFEDEQLQELLSIGLKRLRRLVPQVTDEYADEALSEFYVRRWEDKIKNYDPSKGSRFWSYLRGQFWYFCFDESKKLDKQAKREQGLGEVKIEDGEPIELELVDEGLTPQEMVVSVARYEAYSECRNELSPANQEVIILFHHEELSIKEIAEKLGITENAVKVRLHRARPLLKKCMIRKGWLS